MISGVDVSRDHLIRFDGINKRDVYRKEQVIGVEKSQRDGEIVHAHIEDDSAFQCIVEDGVYKVDPHRENSHHHCSVTDGHHKGYVLDLVGQRGNDRKGHVKVQEKNDVPVSSECPEDDGKQSKVDEAHEEVDGGENLCLFLFNGKLSPSSERAIFETITDKTHFVSLTCRYHLFLITVGRATQKRESMIKENVSKEKQTENSGK